MGVTQVGKTDASLERLEMKAGVDSRLGVEEFNPIIRNCCEFSDGVQEPRV